MHVVLIGADFEENLGLGILAAAAEEAGHRADVVPFDRPEELERVVEQVIGRGPDVVGLSVQFQHRAHEMLALSRRLRERGFAGHVVAGGQFPTMAWRETLEDGYSVDSVALYEGERTLPELLDALAEGRSPATVAGLAVLEDGRAVRTQPRPLCDDLDALPFPKRYRGHTRHLGVPFIPMLGGRGCWGSCSYCSISTFYRDARAQAGGRLMRMRGPDDLADEMAALWHRAGGKAIFCFHDDNFLLPRAEHTRARLAAIRTALDARGVGTIAAVGKCRPETLTSELARELRDFGVIRLYVGVENASGAGGEHLGRGEQSRAIHDALRACDAAGIFTCYNLLVFEPDATLADVRDNLRFAREHDDHPFNFCRAEPYYGTPLHRQVERGDSLGGSYLGFNYRIADTRTELLFRVCAAAFRERNFAPDGVANRYMGLGYAAKICERLYDSSREAAELGRRAAALTRRISRDTADLLERAVELCEEIDPADRDAIERRTALLGLDVAAADRRWHAELDVLFGQLTAASNQAKPPTQAPRGRRPRTGGARVPRPVAIGAAAMAVAWGCDETVVDPAPPDGGGAYVADPPPPDGGGGDMVVDPAPQDAGTDAGGKGGQGGMPVDPPPNDAGMGGAGGKQGRLPLIDKWRDTAPAAPVRDADLPLYDPPKPRLALTLEGHLWRARVEGVRGPYSARYEAHGAVVLEGNEALWSPTGRDDRLRVAVRTTGGVAVISARAGTLST